MTQYRTKVEHYKRKQTRGGSSLDEARPRSELNTNRPTIPPRYLGEFCPLSIFGTASELPKPEKPLGPYICSKTIKLTAGEIRFLSKDPKFSLKSDPSRLTFVTEIERMNSKQRWFDNQEKKKRDCKKLSDMLAATDGDVTIKESKELNNERLKK